MPPIFVAAFALQRQRVSCVRELCHKEWGRGASPDLHSWSLSKPRRRAGMWENKRDEYEKCLIKIFATRPSLRLEQLVQSTGKCLTTQYLEMIV